MRDRPVWLLLALWVPAVALAVSGLSHSVSSPSAVARIVAWQSLAPRGAMALLCGAALGLSGTLAQSALRNRLASPGTLGVSAGAALALAATSLYAPDLLALFGRDTVALAGGAAGIGLVLALTLRSGFDPASVALAGLAVGLYAGSVAAVLAVLHTRQLAGLFNWNAGSLTQLGWDGARGMLLALTLGAGAAALLARPLALLEWPDEVSRGLGVAVGRVRLAALAVSVGLAAAVAARVGVIGFVGLAAPTLARLTGGGGRTLLSAPLWGAGLLLLTDETAQALSRADDAAVPTGALTALLGAPLLLWLLPLVAAHATQPATVAATVAANIRLRPAAPVLTGLAALSLAVAVAALVARLPEGWVWSTASLPRVAAAATAGVALAAAGAVFQRVLGNPMASPEVLGIGTGAMAGSAAALFLGWSGLPARLGFGTAGAVAALTLLLSVARGGGDGSTRIVLAGVALSAGGEAVLALLLASGDPAAETVLLWSAGSTYGTTPALAAAAAGLLLVLLAICAAGLRWLELLPLGDTVARALGMNVRAGRAATLAAGSALAAFGALLAGPLTFVGLVAPHVAGRLGLRRAGGQLAASGLIGATIMMTADWLGRVALFPSEIPAGLLAALLSGPALLIALARSRR